MRRLASSVRTALALSGVFFVLAIVHASTRAEEPASARPVRPAVATPARVAAAAQAANYVGEDTCVTCHDQSIKGTAHGRTFNERTPASTHGCESCHGPGKAHVDGDGDPAKIVNPSKIRATEASEICTTCHDRGKHALWDGSAHDQRNLGCVTCHSVHAPKGPSQLKAKDETTQCATCHRAITHKQLRFNHMPVREGKMSCSSCHNVHGTSNVRLLKAGTTIDEACVSCHVDRRGPYLWEHAPVADSCTTCHDPHGSNNQRMLVARQPFLCQRCHVTSRHPPTVYDAFVLQNSSNANKIAGRSCVVCHQQIHGSNSPSGKALLR